MNWSGKEEDRAQAASARTIYLLASGNSKLEFAKIWLMLISAIYIYADFQYFKVFRCSLIIIFLVSVVAQECRKRIILNIKIFQWWLCSCSLGCPSTSTTWSPICLKPSKGRQKLCWWLSYKVQAQGRIQGSSTRSKDQYFHSAGLTSVKATPTPR